MKTSALVLCLLLSSPLALGETLAEKKRDRFVERGMAVTSIALAFSTVMPSGDAAVLGMTTATYSLADHQAEFADTPEFRAYLAQAREDLMEYVGSGYLAEMKTIFVTSAIEAYSQGHESITGEAWGFEGRDAALELLALLESDLPKVSEGS